MTLPNVISNLIQAQKSFDSDAFAGCFSETAIVFDENKTHTGRQEIKEWNEQSNAGYQPQLEPVDFFTSGKTSVLTTRVSGTFEGSPTVLKYHLELSDGLITALKITS